MTKQENIRRTITLSERNRVDIIVRHLALSPFFLFFSFLVVMVPAQASNGSPSSQKGPIDSSDGNNNSGSPNRRTGVNSKSLNPERDAYIDTLHSWLQTVSSCQYYQSITMASLMASTMSPISISTLGTAPRTSATNESTTSNGQTQDQSQGQLFKLPSLWRRFAAGALDYLILLIVKLLVTFIAVDYFELIDLSKIDLSIFDLNLQTFNQSAGVALASSLFLYNDLDDHDLYDVYKVAFELTSEILIIELIHRVLVIIYETIFLSNNLFTNRIRFGAATPGKLLLNLRVVSCTSLEEVYIGNEELIKVFPAQEIGFWPSLLRSVIKNFSSLFFLPASLTVFISNHNRTAYDVVCRCIVVEARP